MITVTLQGKVCYLAGSLKQDTVKSALAECCALISKQSLTAMTVDLTAVTQCDSSSLALLTTLLRIAKKKQIQLTIAHLPPQMKGLVRVMSLDDILPIVS